MSWGNLKSVMWCCSLACEYSTKGHVLETPPVWLFGEVVVQRSGLLGGSKITEGVPRWTYWDLRLPLPFSPPLPPSVLPTPVCTIFCLPSYLTFSPLLHASMKWWGSFLCQMFPWCSAMGPKIPEEAKWLQSEISAHISQNKPHLCEFRYFSYWWKAG